MAPTSSSVLSVDSILDYVSKSLPTTAEGGSVNLSAVKDPYAAIAIFSHACMLAVGFRLIGLGEDDKIGRFAYELHRHLANLPRDAQSESQDVQPLPSQWNASSSYAFRYAHSQSSLEYLLKVNRLGSKAIIFGVGLGDDKTASFEIKAQDYVSEGSLKEAATSSDTDRKTALRNIFISNGRIDDLASLFKTSIIQKLAPGIHKAGYEESSSSTTADQPRQRQERDEARPPQRDPLRDDYPAPARPYPFDDPLAAAPRRPYPVGDFPPPGFEDEHELNQPPRRSPLAGQPFGNIGERDLYPPGLGPHDPLRIGPGGGGFRGGGGMHPTFDDPLFGGQGGNQPFYNPRAPPGARYDPIGPGDGPPHFHGGPRFPGGGRGGGGNPFGGFGSGDFI